MHDPEGANPYDDVASVYDHYTAADYDVAFFRSEVASADGPVLELMAGTGRLSIPLLEAGARLTCVDRSEGMLAELRRKLDDRGLRAELVARDVRALALGAGYGLAILPFQSFMELVEVADQRAALRSIRACLRAGGRLLLTLHNPAVRRRTVDGVLRAVGSFPTPEGTLVVSGIEQWDAERGGEPVVRRLQFLELFGADGVQRWRRLQPMAFTLIERAALEAMARDAGLAVARLYGDYQRAPFDPERSPVMIFDLLAEG
jgi:SAM-dependent methyltransferase